ncbi:hypothetical protein E2C01_042844 [Portunus trituberculatus]|uniref:Uncharacterized protein n=1 Tax=Portunus trituberculatus TaxID=210409 RepID=A0A5B7FXL8_PORTR|nr:hypothetical protein [Portunus trituberculatus]
MKDVKTSDDARDLLTSVCDLQFIISLDVLKGQDMDVMSDKVTVKTVMKCRDEENFSLLWKKKKKRPSRMLLALTGENQARKDSVRRTESKN